MAAFMDLEDDDLVEDDYYTLLNVNNQATKEEITSAFRRLSKIFHPDKHVDPLQKKNAEDMFNKVKKAYEVLTDPNKRQIYDNFGVKGLEIQGLEVITRTKSPAEIIAELDRYREEQEKRRLEQRTNPRGNITISVNAKESFDRYQGYAEDEDQKRGSLNDIPVEINGLGIAQSVECPLTKTETVGIATELSTKNGRGVGMVRVTCRTTRQMNNKGWAEADITAGNVIGLGGKLVRHINKRCYCMVGVEMLLHPLGLLVPQLSLSLTYQLNKHLTFRATCKPFGVTYGIPTFMRTTLMYDSHQNNASISLQFGLPYSYIKAEYTRKFVEEESRLRIATKYGTLGAFVECGCEKKITMFSWLGATLTVGVPLGVVLRIKLVRGQQVFLVPIHLSDQILPNAVFYGTFIPAVLYSAFKNLIVDPYLRQQEEENLEKKKEEQSERLSEKKRQAETAISLMKETVERIIENEEKRKGLIIVKALYGKLSSIERDLPSHSCVEVTIPLQALVKDSKLILHDRKSMVEMPGFYDPCPGEVKSLYIRYQFREKLHQVTLSDTEALRIPVSKHVIEDDIGSTNSNT